MTIPFDKPLPAPLPAVEMAREVDGRWLANVPTIPGVMAYGVTAEEAARRAEALALRVLADQIELQERAHLLPIVYEP